MRTFIATIACVALLATGAQGDTHDRVHGVDGLTVALQAASARYGVDPLLLQAVIEVESMYRTNAKSWANARGLMQVKPSTAEWIAKRENLPTGNLYDPAYNVLIGAAYLDYLVERFGSWDRAIMAYNLGPNALGRRIEAGEDLPDTYVGKVRNTYQDHRAWSR